MNHAPQITMRLFLQPSDVALFRDGRSFLAGGDHRARSLFPPNPSTVLGALRCKLLMDTGISPEAFSSSDVSANKAIELIGSRDGAPPFSLRGPFIGKLMTDNANPVTYYPIPADIVQVKQDEKWVYHVLQPISASMGLPFRTNWPDPGLHPLWSSETGKLVGAEGWLDNQTLRQYLDQMTPPTQDETCQDEHLFVPESRFGVGLEHSTKRYRDGMLYLIEFIRLREGIGLVVDVVGDIPMSQGGLMGMGGESRAFHYRRFAATQVSPTVPMPRVKVYFATPAYLKNGWLPLAPWSTWFKSDGQIKLVSVALTGSKAVSGVHIDGENQKNGTFIKAGRKYVPAGSVYYFESDKPITYTGQPVSEFDEQDANRCAGYGTVLLGTWEYWGQKA